MRESLSLSYFQTSSKDILFSVSLPPFSCTPCLEYLCPHALIFQTLWHYIVHVLTGYLLSFTTAMVLKLYNTNLAPDVSLSVVKRR